MTEHSIEKSGRNKVGISDVLAAATGLLKRPAEERYGVIGNLVQAAHQRRFVDQLRDEFEDLKESGKIKPEFEDSESCRLCMNEIFEFIDSGEPSQQTFDYIKKLFKSAASNNAATLEDAVPHIAIRTLRQLASDDILVLAACYKAMRRGSDQANQTSYQRWRETIMAESSIKFDSIIDICHQHLHSTGLLGARLHSDLSGLHNPHGGGLTNFGVEVCRLSMTE